MSEVREELNDILQHYGVKGMKWGVRRNRNRPGGADGKDNGSGGKKYGRSDYKKDNKEIRLKRRKQEITRKEALTQVRDNLHKYRSENNKTYSKAYDKAKKKGFSENRSRKKARNTMKKRTETKLTVAGYAAVGVAAAGKMSYRVATSPYGIRKGKNIIQAVKGSPLRYVDGRTMSNIIKEM